MHWIEQDGVKLPKPLGGHPALDFCNTWAGWDEDPPGRPEADPRREWLRDYDAVAAWGRHAGFVDAAGLARLRAEAERHPQEAEAVLEDARSLRSIVHAAVLDPDDADALADLSAYARRAVEAADLRAGEAAAGWVVGERAGLALPVLAVALAATELVTSHDVQHVSACPGVECGWLFLDRRGRRRWCDMAVCGNRAKVAAHARRTKERAAAR